MVVRVLAYASVWPDAVIDEVERQDSPVEEGSPRMTAEVPLECAS